MLPKHLSVEVVQARPTGEPGADPGDAEGLTYPIYFSLGTPWDHPKAG